MGKNDMDHLQHLESVALSDCAVLESKEATYQGSWKRAGGRSAWFMARRNLDRLITMMSPREFPDFIKSFENIRETITVLDDTIHYGGNGTYNVKDLPGSIEASRAILAMLLDAYVSEDIFMKIRANPDGEDGTVLACMRDARRYFMLVEAEMIAEGVVEPESKTYETEHEWDGQAIKELVIRYDDGNAYTFTGLERCLIEREGGTCTIAISPSPSHTVVPAPDPHEQVAREYGLTVDKLKEYLRDYPSPFRGSAPPPPQTSGGYAAEQAERHDIGTMWTDSVGAHLRAGDLCYWTRPMDCTTWIVELAGVDGDLPVVRGEPAVPPEGRVLTSWKQLRRESTPEKKGEQANHAKQNPLWPWQAVAIEFNSMASRVGSSLAESFYTRRAPDVWQLNSVVRSIAIPKEIASAYEFMSEGCWILARRKVPADIDDNFPRLQVEMNMKEHEESDKDFQFMYDRCDDGKFKINDRWSAWGRAA